MRCCRETKLQNIALIIVNNIPKHAMICWYINTFQNRRSQKDVDHESQHHHVIKSITFAKTHRIEKIISIIQYCSLFNLHLLHTQVRISTSFQSNRLFTLKYWHFEVRLLFKNNIVISLSLSLWNALHKHAQQKCKHTHHTGMGSMHITCLWL
jgi:hypothetical protein